MFNHVQVSELPQLKTENINKKRYYITPDGNKYPSITTVLSNRNKKGLFEWRKRVGEDVANYVARTAANRGTKVHHMCEDFLNNKEVSTEPFFAACLFNQLKPILTKKINNIHFQECALYSDKLGIAGRVDCIAEYDGKLSIIDFKTSSRERTDEWNENYYIQASAYAEMYEERTGTPISQIVILVVTEDGTVQEFVREKTEEYLDMLSSALQDFNKTSLSYISN
jgi:hypothetical protein|tara:strand:+ start:500 stop:1174 length:675 start_codon:yes stop_codon:yes gene_type:complete